AKSGASPRSRAASSRSGGSRTGGGRRQQAQRRARQSAQAATAPAEQAADFSAKSVAELREALRNNLVRPFDLVMLTRERIEETLDEAVSRGRMTADDAQSLVTGLLERGRKQTNEVLGDLEQLLSRGRAEIEGRTGEARKRGTDAARKVRDRAATAADPVLVQADRARRVVGVGPSFPLTGYDDLTAAQVQDRLGTLNPAELRKVRDYERRNANRKTVLSAISAKLG
ncbi:MAG: hypothetical protein M3433_05280, partial [Actinomycetota bacterium]|nr:hypothetical protein [Actinomycetota bacterium]